MRKAAMLAVDIGNTSTRLAAFSGETVQARRTFPTAGLAPDELAPALAELAAPTEKKILYAASVVPATDAAITQAAERAGVRVRFIRSGADNILPHALATPATTGVDRLLAALAAGRVLFPGAEEAAARAGGYVVVQCGTAVTVDVVDGAGVFRGGYILPGPGLWLGGLAGAAQLPNLSGEKEEDWPAAPPPGACTRDALLNGMCVALPGAVLAAVRAAAKGLTGAAARAVPVAVTGGWGQVVAEGLPGSVYEPDLVLLGIRFYAERLEAERQGDD